MIRLTILILICWLMTMCSCSKYEWVESTKCNWVYLYSDKYTSDTIYLRTDTLHPFKQYENYLCDSSLTNWRNHKTFLKGCERDGYEQFRYSIGTEISKPVIYKK